MIDYFAISNLTVAIFSDCGSFDFEKISIQIVINFIMSDIKPKE